MQFWSGTPFMEVADAIAVARMVDEAGYDGIICADHLIYPRELNPRIPTHPRRSRRGHRTPAGRIPGC